MTNGGIGGMLRNAVLAHLRVFTAHTFYGQRELFDLFVDTFPTRKERGGQDVFRNAREGIAGTDAPIP